MATKQSEMNLSDKFTIPTQVMARTVGDETVILDLASGTYYGLDPVGARMWQLLADGKSLGEVCDVMFGEYDVARDVLEADAVRLLSELCGRGLVQPA